MSAIYAIADLLSPALLEQALDLGRTALNGQKEAKEPDAPEVDAEGRPLDANGIVINGESPSEEVTLGNPEREMMIADASAQLVAEATLGIEASASGAREALEQAKDGKGLPTFGGNALDNFLNIPAFEKTLGNLIPQTEQAAPTNDQCRYECAEAGNDAFAFSAPTISGKAPTTQEIGVC